MTSFSAQWLALREPFDALAREAAWSTLALPVHAARWRAARPLDPQLKVIDLACGSGANLRALAPQIGGPQRWRLIDHDQCLLAAVPDAMTLWARQHGYRIEVIHGRDATLRIEGAGFSVELATEYIDLARDLGAVGFEQACLVSASALLDLVSAQWLESLIRRASANGAAMLFALSVDGRTIWDAAVRGDDTVHELFGRHQRGDKGFGPALGTTAVPHAGRLLAAAGYATQLAHSDWVIDGARGGAGATAMLAAMIDGMADAAIEQAPDVAETVRDWRARRMARVATSRLTVGHKDLIAVPSSGPGPTTGQGPLGTGQSAGAGNRPGFRRP